MQALRTHAQHRGILYSIFENRRLVWEFARRNLEAQHRGSVAGVTWMVLNPILIFAVYAFVFMVVFTGSYSGNGHETRFEFALALFVSLQVANFIVEAMQASPLAVVQQSNYVKKVVFPLEVLPVSLVVAAFIRCLLASLLIVVLKAVIGGGVGMALLWFPVILGFVFLGAVGIALGLAAVGVFLRDIVPIVQCLSIVLMFVSGVFYSAANLPGNFGFLRYNPLLAAVEASRQVVVWNQHPDSISLAIVAGAGLTLFMIGASLFRTLRPAFADVV